MFRNILLHSDHLLKFRVLYPVGYPTSESSSSSLFRKAHSSSSNNNNALPPTAPQLSSLTSPEEINEAKAWISRFMSYRITRGSVELSFSRSSGPGGQNVNKVNTKATLRCPIDSPWIPSWSKNELKKSPCYTSSSQTLLITSSSSRSQPQNVEDCLSKLHALIVSSASAPIKNEPSEQQKARVRSLERADTARRRAQKDKRSQIKQGRANGKRGGDW